MRDKKKVALLVALTVLIMPMTASAQWSVGGVNVYAIHQSLGLGLSGIDYNETTHIYRARMHYVPNRTSINIGLGILEAIFAINSLPGGFKAYMIINDESLEVQDQLVNFSIRAVQWEHYNGTITDAYYAYAYLYLFENRSVTNPAQMEPFYKDLAVIPYDSSMVLAEESTLAESYVRQNVYCDYDMSQGQVNWVVVAVIAGGVGAFIFVLALLWSRKK